MSDLDLLIPRPPDTAGPSFRYATVTGVSPVRVRLDGDTDPVASTPTVLAAVATGNRVMVLLDGRAMVVLGVVGGGLPTGSVSAYGGSAAPGGWLLCDGAAVSRTTYAALFAVIGTTYGVGDGSSTFNVPNLKGRVPVGRDAAQAEFDTLGETGGAKTHTLTTGEMPAHTHTVYAYANYDDLNFTGNSGRLQASDAVTPYDQATSSTGGSGAHNNLQPYLVLNYIVKV